MTTKPLKIVQFTAENVKKLKVVDITLTKDFITVTGKNGSGKTSILDSIWWALCGKDNIQGKPVRDGAEKAHIRLNLGELIVERRFVAASGNTSLIVETADGARYTSPQAILDEIVGQLAFDPLEFARMAPKAQFDMLRKVSKVEIDLDALAKSDKEDYEARRDANRDVKMLEGQIAGIIVPEDAPEKPVDVGAILNEIEDINRHNQTVAVAQNRKTGKEQSIENFKSQIADLTRQLAAAEQELKAIIVPETKDATALKAQLSDAQRLNAGHTLKQRHAEVDKNLQARKKASDDADQRMKDRAASRDEALKKASLPVAGLSFGQDEVLLTGIPFNQASSAEQIRTSVAIAMAANPKLRIIRIKDGSLLDDEGLKILQDMTTEEGYQVWCEKVDTTGKIGLYMEDGSVKSVNDVAEIVPSAEPKEEKKPEPKAAVAAAAPAQADLLVKAEAAPAAPDAETPAFLKKVTKA